jgi:hypothetical protein
MWDHAIELVPDAKPANCKVYPISLLEQKELDAFISEGVEYRPHLPVCKAQRALTEGNRRTLALAGDRVLLSGR